MSQIKDNMAEPPASLPDMPPGGDGFIHMLMGMLQMAEEISLHMHLMGLLMECDM